MVGSPDLCAALYALGRADELQTIMRLSIKSDHQHAISRRNTRVCAATLLKMIVID
jgi:hypothetical protein